MLFEDPDAFRKIHLKRDQKEEMADKKAAEFLRNSIQGQNSAMQDCS